MKTNKNIESFNFFSATRHYLMPLVINDTYIAMAQNLEEDEMNIHNTKLVRRKIVRIRWGENIKLVVVNFRNMYGILNFNRSFRLDVHSFFRLDSLIEQYGYTLNI